MTDTTREAFEALAQSLDLDLNRFKERYSDCNTDYSWIFYQAATERAAQVERERCAVLADKMTKQRRIVHGGMNAIPAPECRIAAAIRQGGGTA